MPLWFLPLKNTNLPAGVIDRLVITILTSHAYFNEKVLTNPPWLSHKDLIRDKDPLIGQYENRT